MTTMSVVGECFFWYRLTRVVPDNFHRAVKQLCVLCDKDCAGHRTKIVSHTTGAKFAINDSLAVDLL